MINDDRGQVIKSWLELYGKMFDFFFDFFFLGKKQRWYLTGWSTNSQSWDCINIISREQRTFLWSASLPEIK